LINVSLGDVQRAEHVLHFTHDELGVDRVRVFALSHDLKEGHSSAIVVNQGSLAFVASLGSILTKMTRFKNSIRIFPKKRRTQTKEGGGGREGGEQLTYSIWIL